MSKRKGGGLKRIRIIAIGYALMALVLFALQVSRFFVTRVLFESAGMGLEVLAWLILLLGFVGLAHINWDFRKGVIACILGIVLVAAEGYFVYRGLKAGMATDIFIQFRVLLCRFLMLVALLYSYARVFRGYGPFVARFSEKLEGRYRHAYVWVGIFLVLIVVAIPVGNLFSRAIGFAGTFALAALALLLQLYLCKLLQDGYYAMASACGGGQAARKVERPKENDERIRRQRAREQRDRKEVQEEQAREARRQELRKKRKKEKKHKNTVVEEGNRPTMVYSKEELEQALREKDPK